MAHSILHLLPDVEDVLRTVHAMLKPGGRSSRAELETMLTGAGFVIDHDWRPARNRAVFIVAKKPLRDA